MLTRRDQLHAYRFQHERVVAALVTGRANVAEAPMRRLGVTTFSGIMIAILVAVGFAVFGFIEPTAGDSWKQPGAIIVERQTGARFVLIDHVLHPVLNYASAVLAVGNGRDATVVLVDRDDIEGARRGPTVGIDGLPDSLPAASKLVAGPWTVCSRLRAMGASAQARTSVQAGSKVDARAVPAAAAVLVRGVSSPRLYLIYAGRRLAVASDAVAIALGLPAQPLPVGTAFLRTVPPGPALRAPDVPHAGRPSGLSVGGRAPRIGQLLHVTGTDTAGDIEFVVLADGVARLDPVGTALVRTLPIGAGGRPLPPIDTPESVALTLPQSRTDGPMLAAQLAGLPDRTPAVTTGGRDAGALCAIYRDGERRPTIAVPTTRRTGTGPDPLASDVAAGATVTESALSRRGRADHVSLPGGDAALVRAGPHPSSVFLVADPGRKYPVGKDGVLADLGYGTATPTALSTRLLPLLPTGPTLDPAAARRDVGG